MRTAGLRRDPCRAMRPQPRRKLTLDIENGPSDSIAGRVSNETGDGVEFSGWLGLAGALETALEATPADHMPSDEETKGHE